MRCLLFKTYKFSKLLNLSYKEICFLKKKKCYQETIVRILFINFFKEGYFRISQNGFEDPKYLGQREQINNLHISTY